MRKALLFTLAFVIAIQLASSKEGMWVPTLLEKYNLEEMQQMGFKLSAEDVYSVNNSSLKDAIVLFGRGCTAELISEEGLIITNHHCGYRAIQAHSTLGHDYLTNGFWAMDKGEELPNQSLSVKFLEYMEDVTESVTSGMDTIADENKVKSQIQGNIQKIVSEAACNGKYIATVKPLFYGNQYFLYVYKEYKDVRLVGAPPSAIGKFGGDTDNWMWPRHTGDFSLFRIYADENNEPAEYSEKNVPYKPKKFLPISLKGVHKDDFTMVFGYPGSTTEYLPSYAIDIIQNQRDPDRVAIRDKKVGIMKADMGADPLVKIKYAAKYSGVTNAWKKWQGEILGLKRMGAIEKKKAFEGRFKEWAIQNNSWDEEYKQVFTEFAALYSKYGTYIKASDYYSEIVWRGADIFKMAANLNGFLRFQERDKKNVDQNQVKWLLAELEKTYKDYNQATDEKLFAELLPLLSKDINPLFVPDNVKQKLGKYNKQKLIGKLYRKSILSDKEKLFKVLSSDNPNKLLKLRKDPVVSMYQELRAHFHINVAPVIKALESRMSGNMKTYMAGIMEMKKDKQFFPDANGTLRLSYGKVEGYEPKDGVRYKFQTTIDGVIKKHNPDEYHFNVPDKLKELYHKKDYGSYGENGTLPVCFTASNHTSGGNSGSPVLNAEGHLVGVNFDRCWEGTMSDVMYDPAVCRNISIDIRYALFIIDKFAGAGYLLEEMELVK